MQVAFFVYTLRPHAKLDQLTTNAAVDEKWTAASKAVGEGHTLSARSGPGAELLRELDRALAPEPEPEYFKDLQLLRVFANAFEDTYHGKGADGLYEYLTKMDELYQRGSYYAKFLSIVQSSGMGKTRTIFELAQKGVIVLYLNHRENSDVNNWPPQTSVAYKWLNVCAGVDAYVERCHHFFAALFAEMESMLTTLREGNKTRDEVIASWSKIMLAKDQSRYNDFFANVDTRCREYIAMDAASTSGIRETTSGVASLSVADKTDPADKKASPTGGADGDQTKLPRAVVAQIRMETAFTSLCTSHATFIQPAPHQPSIVIAFDEAHSLAKPTTYPPFSRVHVLCRAINTFTDIYQSVWVVFASTNSRIADYSPPNSILHPSSRAPVGGRLICAPYTLVGSEPLAPPLATLIAHPETISKTRNLILFGRPLWHVVFHHFKDKFVEFVAAKLTNLTAVQYHRSALPEASALAILSPRFAIDGRFGHPEAVGYADDAVASHLRVCLATTEDRRWSFTTYGSEPVLSHVAAVLLTEKPSAYEVLESKLRSGMIERGKSGELACRLLLLAGKDTLLNRDPPKHLRQIEWDDDLFYCKPVSLLGYLEMLLGSEIFPDEATKTAITTDFADAHVNFSHWITMSRSISHAGRQDWSCEKWLFRQYARTCAVQCYHSQELVDQVIPVYFGDPNARVSDPLKRMSLIMVSDKATKSPNKRDLDFIDRENSSINCVTEKPSIAILLDTGVREPEVSSTYNACSQLQKRCWRIYAAGIDSKTFPFLSKMNKGSELPGVLNELANPTYLSPEEYPNAQLLRNRLQYGNTSDETHMDWDP